MAKTPVTLLIALMHLLAFPDADCFNMMACNRGTKRPGCPNGKRSGMTEIDWNVRGCKSCGMDNSGQCVNSHICCGDFGCYIGTNDTRVCLGEQEIATPCHPRGRACGDNGESTCAAPGICCNYDYCVFSVECEAPKPQPYRASLMAKLRASAAAESSDN